MLYICQLKLIIQEQSLRLQIQKCLWLTSPPHLHEFSKIHHWWENCVYIPFPLVSKCKIVKFIWASSLSSVTREPMNIATWTFAYKQIINAISNWKTFCYVFTNNIQQRNKHSEIISDKFKVLELYIIGNHTQVYMPNWTVNTSLFMLPTHKERCIINSS